MNNRRMNRVNQLILEEVATIIQNDLNDPKIGFVTVTAVDTKPDLSEARISVSFLVTGDARKTAMEALERSAPFVRSKLGPHLTTRKIPSIRFVVDETAARAERIGELLQNVAKPTSESAQ